MISKYHTYQGEFDLDVPGRRLPEIDPAAVRAGVGLLQLNSK